MGTTPNTTKVMPRTAITAAIATAVASGRVQGTTLMCALQDTTPVSITRVLAATRLMSKDTAGSPLQSAPGSVIFPLRCLGGPGRYDSAE